MEALAHSARDIGRAPQSYAEHILNVRNGARDRALTMLSFAKSPEVSLASAIEVAAEYHDIGKLDPDNQAALRIGRNAKLPWDHIDAGVAHLMASKNNMAAWLVRAHHAPGLPCLR